MYHNQKRDPSKNTPARRITWGPSKMFLARQFQRKSQKNKETKTQLG
jgi:hypothetical protein